MKTKNILRGMCALLLGAMMAFPHWVISPEATTDDYASPAESVNAHSLPYSATLTFTHDGSASGEVINDIRCKKLSIVTVSAIGNIEGDRVELRAYTDSGELIAISSAAEGESCILQFLPAYTGSYRIITACRNTSAEISEVSLYVSEFTKYKANDTGELPISEDHSKKTHKYSHASSLLPAHAKDADGWEVSVFSFSHGAGDVLSYRVSTAGDMLIRAALFTYEGSVYRPHPSYAAQSYEAADAQQLHYAGDAYLLVYSSGEFTLEADLLECRASTPEPISLPLSGKLDMTGGEMCYDETEYAKLISEFPFCGVKNTYVKYFSIEADKASVISLMCERREHASFSLVSDERGLSSGSVFPLRSYSSYCSETKPTEMCLDAVVSDSGRAYVVYTGSSLDAYVEIEASHLYSTDHRYESEYHKNTPIPAPKTVSLYSDSALFSRIGLSPHDSESTETVGYVIECEDGTKYYCNAEDPILPPEKKGECRLYAAVRRICVRDSLGEGQTHLVPICTFKTTGVLFIPTIEEIIEDIENNEPVSALYFLILLIPIAGAGAAVYLVVLRKRKRRKAKHTRIKIETKFIDENDDIDTEDDDD